MFELTDDLKRLIDPSCNLGVIAQGLGRIGRFGGRGAYYYPVLAHSIVVGDILHWPWKIYGYLHDMAEVIVGGIGHPFKTDEQREVEEVVHNYMPEQLGMPYPSVAHANYIKKIVGSVDRDSAIAEAYVLQLQEVINVEGKPDKNSGVYKETRRWANTSQERWFSIGAYGLPAVFVWKSIEVIPTRRRNCGSLVWIPTAAW